MSYRKVVMNIFFLYTKKYFVILMKSNMQ